MWAVLAFWIFLAVPGFACLCRFDRKSLEGGWLSVIVRSYVASMTLLTPISVLGYVLHLRVAAVSLAYLGLVVVAIASIIRDRDRGAWFRHSELSVIAVLGLCVLMFDLVLGARAGSHVQGDAAYHIARVRMLLESGLGSWDPLLPGLQFEATYHTNLYHALIAASAHLAGVDAGAAWVWVWPFTKFMAAAASYELALAVFGVQRLAWVAAIGTSAWLVTQSVLPYPNTWGPYACLAFAFATTVIVASGEPSFRSAAWLGAAGLLTAQVHMLYATFFVLLAAPVLLVRLGYAVVRRTRGRPQLFVAVLCLAAPGPWLLVPALPRVESFITSTARAQARESKARAPTPKERKERMFVDAGEGRVRLKPEDFISKSTPVTYLLFALAALALVAHRRAAWVVIALSGVLFAYLFVPLLCTALVELLTGRWVVLRMSVVPNVFGISLLPAAAIGLIGSVAQLVWPRPAPPALRASATAALQLAGCAAALGYTHEFAPRYEPWSVAQTWQAFQLNRARVNADRISERAQFFATVFRQREVVLAPLMLDYYLPMHCNCSPFAFRAGRGDRDIADIRARRGAADRFFARSTSAAERVEIARRHRIKYVYSSARRLRSYAADLAPLVKRTHSSSTDAMIELHP